MINSRILGIDYGTKRVGVAISDESNRFALPLVVVPNTYELLAKIEKIVLDNKVGEVVMGESRDYKGEPNKILEDSEVFKKQLESKGLIVHFEPEFMTSVQAERIQGKNNMSDASAAAIILQSYIDKLASQQPPIPNVK
jgi:putative Holliday junction resolvase